MLYFFGKKQEPENKHKSYVYNIHERNQNDKCKKKKLNFQAKQHGERPPNSLNRNTKKEQRAAAVDHLNNRAKI